MSPQRSYLASGLTRRQALKASGSALALASAGGLLAACGDDDDSGGSSSSTPPKRGGTLVFGMESPPGGFDPQKWWTDQAALAAFSVFDRLFEPQTLEPMLLTKKPTSEGDGLRYTFDLRKGVKFHHGREMTSDDVKFSIERIVLPETESQGAGTYQGLPIVGMDAVVKGSADELSGIKLVDDHSFTIELEQPDARLLYLLSIWFASVIPRDVFEEMGAKKFNFAPVGTGPFMMEDVKPDKGLTLVRNPNYWKRGKPYVDKVVWNFGIEPSLSVLRIQSGEQDLMFETLDSGQISQIRNDPRLEPQMIVGDTSVTIYYTLDTKQEALSKLPVRQAIAMAIDKERLVKTIKGMGTPADGGVFGPETPYYQPGIGYKYDPDEAKRLLTEAGYPDGFKIEYIGKNFSPFKEVGEVLGADLGKIGIDVDLNLLPFDAWLAELDPWPQAIAENFWDLAYPHGSYVMDSSFTTAGLEGCCNQAEWTDPEYDKLAKEAHGVLDEDEQVEIYKELDRIPIQEEALWVPAVYQKAAILKSDRLQGFEFYAPSPNTGKFFSEYWVT
jgi:ABC-type transport system substrate-binding protein